MITSAKLNTLKVILIYNFSVRPLSQVTLYCIFCNVFFVKTKKIFIQENIEFVKKDIIPIFKSFSNLIDFESIFLHSRLL
jgi:hypothetical protein